MIINSIPLAISLALGGLGIFLIAVKLMSNSLKTMSGGYTVRLMKKFSANKWLSLAFGIGFTTMIQSSDGAVALVIGLIAAGLMDLRAAIPFILGANIGTATTSLIVWLGGEVNFTQYFMILAFVGAMGYLIIKEEKKSNIAMLIFAIGAIFIGLKVLGAGMKEVAGTGPFHTIVKGVSISPWSSLFASIGLTGLMQSSSATVTIVQNIYEGDGTTAGMDISSAIAMVIGANIGTTFTALITSIGSNKDSKRIAFIWLITNISMAIIVMPIIGYYAQGMTAITSQHMLQLASAHLIFNTLMVFIFIWFTKYLESISRWVIKDQKVKLLYKINLPKDLIYHSPDLALLAAKEALISQSHMTDDSLKTLYQYLKTGDKKIYTKFKEIEHFIELTRRNVYAFLVELGSANLTTHLANKHMAIVLTSRSLERIPDLGHQFAHELNNFATKVRKSGQTASYYKFDVEENDLQVILKALKMNITLIEEVRKKLIDPKSVKTASIKKLVDELEIFIVAAKREHIKNLKNIKSKYDFVSNTKYLLEISQHVYRIAKYVRKGDKNIHLDRVSDKLQKELTK